MQRGDLEEQRKKKRSRIDSADGGEKTTTERARASGSIPARKPPPRASRACGATTATGPCARITSSSSLPLLSSPPSAPHLPRSRTERAFSHTVYLPAVEKNRHRKRVAAVTNRLPRQSLPRLQEELGMPLPPALSSCTTKPSLPFSQSDRVSADDATERRALEGREALLGGASIDD